MRTEEVLIVVRRGDEYLVLRRTPENDGYWHVVAGGVEEGESFAAAAARELWEETALRLAPEPLSHSFVYGSVTVECFLAEAPSGWEPTLNDEHDEYRWLGRTEAADLLFWPEPAALVRTLP